MSLMSKISNASVKMTNVATADDATSRGNFTLDDYLQMVDNAESARRARGGWDGADGASIETHASAAESQTSVKAKEQVPAKLKQEDDIVPTLEGMGIDQLMDIFSFLALMDRVRVLISCKHMHAQQEACDKSIRTLCVDRHGVGKRLIANRVEEATRVRFDQRHPLNIIHRSRELQWSRLSNLRELNVGTYCTDQFLAMISGGNGDTCTERSNERGDMMLPELERLGMSRSCHVAEEALLNLTTRDGSGRIRTNLRELDAAFCSNITYEAVIQFRTLLPNCLLRRLPEWMCGHTETPFGENDMGEVHTYWPDGTFSYNREHQSKGFVMRIDILGSDASHVSEKLQFIDLDTLERMPSWFRSGFRPSVSLLRLERDIGTAAQHVLVAQRKGGIKHLKFFPKKEQAQIVPLGSSRHFDLEGKCLNDDEVESSSQGRNFTLAMVSHMRKSKLQKEEHFSPLELVGEIASYLERTKETDEEIRIETARDTGFENTEDLVDGALSGIAALVETENDYRYNDNMVATPLNPDAPRSLRTNFGTI